MIHLDKTKTATFEADATRFASHDTTTLPAEQGGRVQEVDLECVHDFEKETSLCEIEFVEKGVDNGTTTTAAKLRTTYTASPSAWVTITNAIAARPSASGGVRDDEDAEGGEQGGARGEKLLAGAVVVGSIGMGAVLLLA